VYPKLGFISTETLDDTPFLLRVGLSELTETLLTFEESVFWDVTPCGPVDISQRPGLLLALLFIPENGRNMFL
jgi:hypothetical protein